MDATTSRHSAGTVQHASGIASSPSPTTFWNWLKQKSSQFRRWLPPRQAEWTLSHSAQFNMSRAIHTSLAWVGTPPCSESTIGCWPQQLQATATRVSSCFTSSLKWLRKACFPLFTTHHRTSLPSASLSPMTSPSWCDRRGRFRNAGRPEPLKNASCRRAEDSTPSLFSVFSMAGCLRLLPPMQKILRPAPSTWLSSHKERWQQQGFKRQPPTSRYVVALWPGPVIHGLWSHR